MDFERPPVYFDIETGQLPRAEVDTFLPEFETPKNYKDEAKIAEALAKKESEWFKKAALAVSTGKVLAVGYCTDENDITVLEVEEASILTAFWNAVTYRGAFLQKLVGFNSNSFDIPFLVRRSWKLGVSVPQSLFKVSYGRVRLNANCIDMLDFWSFGTRDSIKLRDLAKFLGVGEKTGSGADFAAPDGEASLLGRLPAGHGGPGGELRRLPGGLPHFRGALRRAEDGRFSRGLRLKSRKHRRRRGRIFQSRRRRGRRARDRGVPADDTARFHVKFLKRRAGAVEHGRHAGSGRLLRRRSHLKFKIGIFLLCLCDGEEAVFRAGLEGRLRLRPETGAHRIRAGQVVLDAAAAAGAADRAFSLFYLAVEKRKLCPAVRACDSEIHEISLKNFSVSV